MSLTFILGALADNIVIVVNEPEMQEECRMKSNDPMNIHK